MATRTRSARRPRTASQHTPSEETAFDPSFSLPHVPMHVHFDDHNHEDQTQRQHGLKGDRGNIALLMFLYVLQGIPLGLAGSIPYLLQSRQVNYKDQAMFSFVYWPFSVKLLWAPIVDSAYFPAFGRRKSWLVPTQYLIGLFMLVLSSQITDLLGEGEGGGEIHIPTLTVIFFILNFLAATQDIAVDGWALTILSRRNVGWASTCNSVGQTAGYFLGNVVFLALESAGFCNRYLRSAEESHTSGMVTLAGFLWFWGIVFFVTTSLVMVLKREVQDENASFESVTETYKLLWKLIKLPAVMSLIFVLLTSKIGFAASDAVTGLKLIQGGVPKDSLALLGIPIVPIQIMLPLLLSKYTAGPKPMDVFLRAMPYRLFMGLIFALIVWWAPSTTNAQGEFPVYFYAVVLAAYALHQVSLYSMFVSQMAFFAKVSDPAIGGTYMTLLNTVTNFGGNWPSTVALSMVDSLTWKSCVGADGSCSTATDSQTCGQAGGSCVTTTDGYYVESVICVFIGLAWWLWKRKQVKHLQDLPPNHWTCSS